MRSITFVDRLTFDFHGNIAQNAICLGDFDNDGNYEMCVGNSLGYLAIYKGASPNPWKHSNKLGHIVAITSGDLFNRRKKYLQALLRLADHNYMIFYIIIGHNVLVVVSADGFCRIFDLSDQEPLETSADNCSTPVQLNSPSNGDSIDDQKFNTPVLRPCFKY
jgi:hypothetical protein